MKIPRWKFFFFLWLFLLDKNDKIKVVRRLYLSGWTKGSGLCFCLQKIVPADTSAEHWFAQFICFSHLLFLGMSNRCSSSLTSSRIVSLSVPQSGKDFLRLVTSHGRNLNDPLETLQAAGLKAKKERRNRTSSRSTRFCIVVLQTGLSPGARMGKADQLQATDGHTKVWRPTVCRSMLGAPGVKAPGRACPKTLGSSDWRVTSTLQTSHTLRVCLKNVDVSIQVIFSC